MPVGRCCWRWSRSRSCRSSASSRRRSIRREVSRAGSRCPPNPQWGNFLEAFKVANMSALLASSVFIVLAVVPIVARHLDDGRLRDRLAPHPRRGTAAAPVRVRADAAVRGDHHPALLPCAADGDPQHTPRDRPAAHRPVHAVRRVLDARPLRQHAQRDLGGGAGRWRQHMGSVLADPRAAGARADGVARDPDVGLGLEPVPPCPGARGGPDAADDGRCSRAPSRVTTRRTSRSSAPGPCSSSCRP